MTLVNIMRIAKVIALLAFVLPWVAVSCNNVDIATASGIELMQGRMSSNPDAERQIKKGVAEMFNPSAASQAAESAGDTGLTAEKMPELGLNFFAIAAFIVIAAGLALTFTGKGRTATRNVLITSLLGLVLAYGSVWWWKDSVMKKDGPSSAASSGAGPADSDSGMSGAARQMVDSLLQERLGYWACLGALAVAAGAAGFGMAGGAQALGRGQGSPPAEPPSASAGSPPAGPPGA